MRAPKSIDPAWFALFAAIGVRTLLGFSRLDDGSPFQNYTANIAVAVLKGLPLELAELPIIPHNRGSMLVGLASVPLVALLGNTLIAIKAQAILHSGATAFLFARIVDRNAGSCSRPAAWAAALLYAFLPPSFQILDVMPLGSHVDTLLFDFAALAYLLTWTKGEPTRARRAFALGLTAGLGTFFSLHFLVVLPALFVAWWALDRRFFLRPAALAFLPGAALTFTPSFLFMSRAAQITQLVNRPIENRFAAIEEVPLRFVEALLRDVPDAWLFDLHGVGWARPLFAVTVLAGLLLLLPRLCRREPCALFFASYPLLLLGAYSAMYFEMNFEGKSGIGTRQISPLIPCFAAWIALGFGELVARGRTLPAGLFLAGGLIAGVGGVAALVNLRVPTGQPPARGSRFALFKDHVEHASAGDPLRMLAWLERLEPDWSGFRPLALNTIHWRRELWRFPEDFAEDVRAAAAGDPLLAPFHLVSIGRALGKDPDLPRFAHPLLETFDSATRRWVLLGLGQTLGSNTTVALLMHRARGKGLAALGPILQQIREESPGALTIAEGMGFQFGDNVTPYDGFFDELLPVLQRFAPAPRRAFLRGMGWGYRMHFVEATYELPTYLAFYEKLGPEEEAALREGLTWGGAP